MARVFIILLLLAVFFLSGMAFGIDKNNDDTYGPVDFDDVVEEVEVQEVEEPKQSNPKKAALLTEEDHLVQKIAGFLDKIVRAFYELVVHVLYRFAELFFE
ncbi:hypothetical protein ACLIBH_12090 [Virgibacillus sp. W0430]|uniref:hypothetical protein n=1 Tax=Virgibacillus sp. W0430 TaxID=3391580 RepID=UPI003F448C03